MSNETVYKNLIAFHPGYYVEEIFEELNITQKEFAHRLNTTEKSLSKLMNGEDNLLLRTGIRALEQVSSNNNLVDALETLYLRHQKLAVFSPPCDICDRVS